MKKKMRLYKAKNYAIIGLALTALIISGCEKETTKTISSDIHTPEKHTNIVIDDQIESSATALMELYFGKHMSVQEVTKHPSGLAQIAALTNEGTTKILWMLPDNKHIIDGTLYSPNTTKESVTQKHRTASASVTNLKSTQVRSQSEMKKELASAISGGGTKKEIKDKTKAAIQTRIQRDIDAKRAHVAAITKSMANGITPNIETAALPRNNSIADKNTLFKDIQNSNYIAEGENNKVLYVFSDINCGASKDVHKLLASYTSSNDLQVRYIPVGALGPNSQAKATLILAQEDNNARLGLMNRLLKIKKGDDLPDIQISPEQKQNGYIASMQNFKLLLDSKRVATPTFAYMSKNGPIIAVLRSKKSLQQAINSIIN